MMKIKCLILTLAFIMTMLISLSVNAAQIKVTFGHFSAPGQTTDLSARKFQKLVSEKSQGEMSVVVYPSSQLGGERELINGMQMGSIEMAIVAPNFTMVGFAQEFGLYSLSPYFLFDDSEHYRRFMDGPMGKKMKDLVLENKGVRIAAIVNRGPRYITSNVPITSPKDLKGIKIRIPKPPIY